MRNPFKRCERPAHGHRYVRMPEADMSLTVGNEGALRDLLRALETRTDITININYFQIVGDITDSVVTGINNIR